MRPELLSLGASHFQRICEALRGQEPFSDPRKTQFRHELVSICDNLMENDFMTFSSDDIENHHYLLSTLFMPWAMALDTRNAYTLSSEMRAILDSLNRIWVNSYNQFIFAAEDGDFSCSSYNPGWDLLIDIISNLYGVNASYQLVVFNIPKHLHDDFLFVGSLYHEMGHFVEAYYNITDKVLERLKKRLNDPVEEAQIREVYFPIIKTTYQDGKYTNVDLRDSLIRNQLCEYISDLFGTQYLGKHIGNHIEYVASEHYDEYDKDHPSPNCRRMMAEAFMNDDRTNFVYADIFDVFAANIEPLRIRFGIPRDHAALDKGEAIKVQDENELHSLIWYGWEVYLRGPQAMANAQGDPTNVLSQYEFYMKINGAIRDSIKGYVTP